MNLEKQKAFIIRCIFIFILLILLYVGIKYVFPLLMPFVIGMIVAMAFRGLIDMLSKKTNIKRGMVSVFVLIAFYGLVGFLISMVGVKIFNFISTIFIGLPALYQDTLLPAFEVLTVGITNRFPSAQTYVNEFVSNIDQSIFEFISTTSSAVVSAVTGLASQIPTLLIKLIFTIVSSFFFTVDYYKIGEFILSQFNQDRQEVLIKLKNNIIGSLGKFIKAYAAIISITFLELSTGFWIMGIPTPYLFGGLVAIIDIMPILGTGAVLIPWAIIGFIMGNTKIGAGMLILYIVITVVRQILEPKIVGQQIGLHPIVTLILMYVGAQLMGILGLFALPIIATILVQLDKEGSIHLLKKPDSE
ncbi:sporulation integral membrane protein YtvI [Konateibacter massiliensis]|uniref:sporulation integral membrane protein YtvI n=1 Tax=Konateibacter massiliensis TaxID=2002841 RepID=UPI000C145FEC|nr:sporulation integral membrane protein YtvI [Konateibacter massiliensis]